MVFVVYFWIGQKLVMLEDEGCPRDILYLYSSCFEGLAISQFSLLGVSIATLFIYKSGSSPQPSSLVGIVRDIRDFR